jgi:Outer membrane protein beta-barrel domain
MRLKGDWIPYRAVPNRFSAVVFLPKIYPIPRFATTSSQKLQSNLMIFALARKDSMDGYRRRYRSVRAVSKVAPVAAALLCLASGSYAQSLSSSNVFAGYSFSGANLFSGQHANLNGWNVSAEKKYLPYFGIIADFSGLYGSKALPASTACVGSSQAQCVVNSSVSEYSFQGGIRGSYAAAKVRPFAELLFGAVHTDESGRGLSNSNNGFAATLGAGLDCRLTRLLGCRAVLDYIVTGNFNARQNSIRASTGIVFRF